MSVTYESMSVIIQYEPLAQLVEQASYLRYFLAGLRGVRLHCFPCNTTSITYESMSVIIKYEPLAQLVEHLTFNQRVGGSSPPWLIPRDGYCISNSVSH